MSEMTDDEVFGSSAPQSAAPKEMSDEEVFGAPQLQQEDPPASFLERFNAGAWAQQAEQNAAKKTPSGLDLISTPEGRTKLWNAIKGYPQHFLEGMVQTLETPGDVYSGKVDLSTPEGMDRALDLGVLVGMGRLNKLPLTAQTAGEAIRAGEGISRIKQVDGQVVQQPVGGLPTPQDFTNAARVLDERPQGGVAALINGKLLKGRPGETHADLLERNGVNLDDFNASRGDSVDLFHLPSGEIVNRNEMAVRGLAESGEDIRDFGLRPTAEQLATPFEERLTRRETIEQNLRRMWQEDGIHPAEAVHDADRDAFLKHEITAPSFTVFHGTPHDFDRFDISKIGTGEGAQAYGHGLYFAENEGVAADYRDKLSDKSFVGDYAKQYLDRNGGDAAKAAEELRAHSAAYEKNGETSTAKHLNEAADLVETGWRDSQGNLYQVRINADHGKFLDWETPLKDQTPEVQEMVKHAMGIDYYGKFDPDKAERMWNEHKYSTGGIAVRQGHIAFSDENVAKRLSNAGIPGIKYLDQGSRGAGEGSRNYVVFSDKDVEITHKNGVPVETIPKEWMSEEASELLSADDQPMSLSAARTDPSELPSPDVQPVRPGLAAQASKAVQDWNGLATNIQYMLDPMATGSKRAIVPAKDAMNSVRRIRWDHARIDADLVKKFDPEALDDMWRAADEESVARQTGDIANENIGLSRLEPEQRAAVDQLQRASQAAWLQAVDAGMVEGEGLPSYTPRMMANVAMASDSMGPRALNELGRNVFTRTAQMLHRGNLEAHETEAAARELVRSKMFEQGASVGEIEEALKKVNLIRNIRVLPLATARLQEAAVWRNMINQIEAIGKATGEDTVAHGTKPQGWFTIDHPSFRKWRPKMGEQADGTVGPIKDGNGNIVFEPVPIYMHPEFRGPMKAILDEGANVAKAIPGAQSAYGALMALKGKSMTAILNSPLIHNQVVWGKVAEAAGGKEWMGLGLYFRGNKIVNGVTGRAQELIERGLNPLGKRASYQDLTGEMEAPEFGAPGRSLTAKIARMIPDLFDEARPNQTVGGPGDKVAAAIDRAGDFWHNTLLWDRVRDVHFGLADHLSDKMVADGVDRLMADRIATHFSNIIVGSIPKEAMSAGARATANMLLFSRSFTLGNLSTFKQAALGLPKPLLAQIERDFGMPMEQAAEGSPEAAAQIAKISQTAKSISRRKAVSTIAMSVGLYYTVNALVQHAFNVIARDSTVNDELKGYARRWTDAVSAIKEDPFEVRHLLARMSPTWDNEPWKQDRAYVGNDSRGTGIYARIPMGKFGEELAGYATKPMTMLRGKLSPLASGLLDVLMNDSGFGQKVYNEHDSTIRGDIQTAWAVAKHLVLKHLPEGQGAAIGDLLRGDGDKTVNVTRLVGPALGFTTSQGAPGGPQRGEQMEAKEDFQARFSLAWPNIKKQIQRGDEPGAQQAMHAIGVPTGMQRGLIRTAKDPASALRGRTLLDFFQYATPEQKLRFESKSKHPGAPQP